MLRFGVTAAQCLTQTLSEVLDFLALSGALRLGTPTGYELVGDLPENFALNQSLAPFILDFLRSFHCLEKPDLRPSSNESEPEEEEHSPVSVLFNEVLDVISVTEAVLDDSPALLCAQERSEKDRMFAELKVAGADYEQRQAALEKITYPRPLGDQLNVIFEVYCEENLWAKYFQPRAKLMLHDMIGTGATSSSHIVSLASTCVEGQLLCYPSDAWRALNQIVPEQLWVLCFPDMMEWLQQPIHEVDPSLLDERKYLENPDLRRAPMTDTTITDASEFAFGQRVGSGFDWPVNPEAAMRGLRRVAMTWPDAMTGDEFKLLTRMEKSLREASLERSETLRQFPLLGERHWDTMFGEFWQAHDFMDAGAEGRNKRNFELYTISDEVFQFIPEATKIVDQIENHRLWVAELAIADGNKYLDFVLYMTIDPTATLSITPACPAWVPLGLWSRL